MTIEMERLSAYKKNYDTSEPSTEPRKNNLAAASGTRWLPCSTFGKWSNSTIRNLASGNLILFLVFLPN
ncbi:hypothetical protein LguiA_036462 [Lonicera macranthoides]